LKTVDIIGIFSGILGIVFCVITIDDLKLKIIISLLILIIILIIKIITSYLEIKKKNAELKDLKIKHSALSKQYKSKNSKLYLYEYCWIALDAVFKNTLQSSEEKRFKTAHELYLSYYKKMILDEENSNNEYSNKF